jgi:hypothetical protein
MSSWSGVIVTYYGNVRVATVSVIDPYSCAEVVFVVYDCGPTLTDTGRFDKGTGSSLLSD